MKRLHAGLPGNVLLVLDAAYAEYVRRNDYASGVELAAEAENVVMTRTFSKVFGLANLRIGWAYGPAAVIDALNRTRGPFNVNGPALAAGAAALADRAHLERAVAHNAEWLDWLTREVDGARPARHAEHRQFPAHPFSARRRAAARRRPIAFLRERGLVLRRVAGYGLPNALRMTVGTRGGEPRLFVAALARVSSRRRERGLARWPRHDSSEPPRADRHRADRLVDRARRARNAGSRGEIVVQSRRAETVATAERLKLGDRYTTSAAEAAEDADLVILSIPVGACGDVAKEIAPALKPGAIVSDVGSVKASVIRQMRAASARRTCISCRRIRSPAPSIPGRKPASPSSSQTAGAS